MRAILYFTALFLMVFVYGSVAEEGNLCKSCSLSNENELLIGSGSQHLIEDKSDSEVSNRISVSNTDNGTSAIKNNNKANFEDVLFRTQINRLDDILNQYKNNEEGIFANTKKNIDLLSGFRTGDKGQDLLVPLGFFVYLNKKF